MMKFILCLIVGAFSVAKAGTGISITNNYKKELNIKIQGSGVGGCDIIMQPGDVDTSDCWCLWGTINYSFCAYKPSIVGGEKEAVDMSNYNSTLSVGDGRCPAVTGESLVCSDLSSLGNCYDGSYACEIDTEGLCHCHTV